MNKRLIIGLGILLAFAMVAWAAASAPTGKITITTDGSKEAVFDHTAHVDRAENCQTCHHKDAAGSEQKCTTCHTKVGKDGAPDAKTAFHKKCGDCHKLHEAAPQYPKGCKVCHPPK